MSTRRAADRQPQGRNRGRRPAVEIDHHLPLRRHQIAGAGVGQGADREEAGIEQGKDFGSRGVQLGGCFDQGFIAVCFGAVAQE